MANEQVSDNTIQAWAKEYVRQQKMRMAAMQAAGGKPERPSRAEVTRALRARFSGQEGISLLTWARIIYWVAWILLAL